MGLDSKALPEKRRTRNKNSSQRWWRHSQSLLPLPSGDQSATKTFSFRLTGPTCAIISSVDTVIMSPGLNRTPLSSASDLSPTLETAEPNPVLSMGNRSHKSWPGHTTEHSRIPFMTFLNVTVACTHANPEDAWRGAECRMHYTAGRGFSVLLVKVPKKPLAVWGLGKDHWYRHVPEQRAAHQEAWLYPG